MDSDMAVRIRRAVLFAILIFALWSFFRTGSMGLPSIISGRASWKTIAAERRAEIHKKIPTEWLLPSAVLEKGKQEKRIVGSFIEGLLDSDTLKITSLDPVEIASRIATGALTSVKVVTAFCKRAAFAHQLNNNLLEITFEPALKRAAELDRFYEKHHKTIGPLHGLPVTFKDQFHQKGLPATMAYIGWIGTFEGQRDTRKEETTESELVRELNVLGAIPIAKTSLVQSLWAGETNNNIMGYNWNPSNQLLSSGGSSGGEGALQSLRGSTFGFGTDIGGSVSMPGAFNGIYSFKPSTGRISFKDVATSSPGQQTIPSVVGALGPSIATLRLVFKSLVSTKPWLYDPDCLAIPFREQEEVDTKNPPKLSFGKFEADGVVTPHPPIIRAVRMAAKALQTEGHKIIDWNPPSHSESSTLHSSFTYADGMGDVLDNVALSGEPLVPQIEHMFAKGRIDPVPLLDFYNSTIYLKDFRARYQAYWQSTKEKTGTDRPVDAVILPASPHAAVLPGKYYYYTYSSFVNVLDYVSITIPVTTADKRIDPFDRHYKPLSEIDRKTWQAYDPEAYDGAPASIQLLGRRLEEEKLLSIAQIVVDALAKYPKGSME